MVCRRGLELQRGPLAPACGPLSDFVFFPAQHCCLEPLGFFSFILLPSPVKKSGLTSSKPCGAGGARLGRLLAQASLSSSDRLISFLRLQCAPPLPAPLRCVAIQNRKLVGGGGRRIFIIKNFSHQMGCFTGLWCQLIAYAERLKADVVLRLNSYRSKSTWGL